MTSKCVRQSESRKIDTKKINANKPLKLLTMVVDVLAVVATAVPVTAAVVAPTTVEDAVPTVDAAEIAID